MSVQNALRFFGNDAISTAPYGDLLPGLQRATASVAPATDQGADEQPMIALVEVLWALIAVAAACGAAIFLAS